MLRGLRWESEDAGREGERCMILYSGALSGIYMDRKI